MADTPEVVITKSKLSIWNVVSAFGGIAITAFGWGVMYNTMTNNDAKAERDILSLTSQVDTINKQLPRLNALEYEVRRANEQYNDFKENSLKMNESVSTKLDMLTETINKLNVRIEVIGTQMDRRPKPTSNIH